MQHKLIKNTLQGVGQIFLQDNALTGAMIIIAMCFSHWSLGLACLIGSLIGTLTAQFLRFPAHSIQQGLYGFNASLVMMCAVFTFGPHIVVWAIASLFAILATLIMQAFLKANKIAFTFPFVLSCWGMYALMSHFHPFDITAQPLPLADLSHPIDDLGSPFYAWAEVNFGNHILTGGLVFLAIALNNPNVAMWGTASALLGTVFAHHLFGVEHQLLANGIYGFSPILVACVFAGSQLRDFLLVIIGTLLAVIIQYSVIQTGIPAYTIGFIVASWLMLIVKGQWGKSESKQYT